MFLRPLGIYHSHPQYVENTISGVDSGQIPIENDTPFSILKNNNIDVIYKDFMIPLMKITMKGALAKVPRGINKVPLKFHLTSSNPKSKLCFCLSLSI